MLYSAKDLINFLGCEHCTALDLVVRVGEMPAPEGSVDDYLELLKAKGLSHERGYLAMLRAEGRTIREIVRVDSLDEMAVATRQAMRDGVDVIYQGALVNLPWHGYSDFLLRVEGPSGLGGYSYEVADTKLARSAKPKHVFQLCLYSQLVALEQELQPERAHVVLGDGHRFTLKVNDYLYYVDTARERFQAFASESGRDTHAERCAQCDLCRWLERCDAEWEAKDDLRLVARLGASQATKLTAAGVVNLRQLAAFDGRQIAGMQAETVERLQSQARLQLVNRTTGEHEVEVLPLETQKGFARLPRPDAGDLFFDMEGDPVYSAGGSLEYLFGFNHVDGGKDTFTAFWARDRASEKKAFEDALDFITERLRRTPDAFVYHYASYEETALKRLAQKYGSAPKKQVGALKRLAQEYGTRENEVDDLLRNRKLVDLYKVVREGVRTSEPGYSLKNMEVFYAPERTQEIKSGGESVVAFERWLALGGDDILQQLADYNAFDCRSTRLCRDWLLSLRPPGVEWFDPALEADQAEAEERQRLRGEGDARILALRAALVFGVPEADQPWRLLLGHLLEYHRREARQEWWRYFDRRDSRVEELIDDLECLGGVTVDPDRAPRAEKKSMIWPLRFPDQETKLRAGKKVVRADTDETLEIVSLDQTRCCLELKVGPTRQALAGVFSLIPQKPRDDTVQRDAIIRYAQAVIDGREAEYGAVTSVLRRDKPRLRRSIFSDSSAGALGASVRAVVEMEDTHLIIQGPPGTGKTFTSAHAIVELLRLGKRVGVTALSHKAINNLLHNVENVARERGVTFRGIKKSSNDQDEQFGGDFIEDTTDNSTASSRAYQLVAGTAWLFSRPELDRTLDYLFIDEAGQVSLANVVAMGGSARNIVLVGDQMQLSQPMKGSHPGGSGISALDHLMQDWATVPADRGIFLGRTWRLNAELCRFVSQAFYDGRLEPEQFTARQKLVLNGDAGGALASTGLQFIDVQHAGNTQRSEEEAACLNELYGALLGQHWLDRNNDAREITSTDILVVSPYNMQVNLLKQILPAGAQVGTVDKFQGQEGAVVMISLASSSGDNIPRGIEFLFSRNRLNVAISRARCLAVVFASPLLLSTSCHSVPQVQLVNTLCWMNAVAAQERSHGVMLASGGAAR